MFSTKEYSSQLSKVHFPERIYNKRFEEQTVLLPINGRQHRDAWLKFHHHFNKHQTLTNLIIALNYVHI